MADVLDGLSAKQRAALEWHVYQELEVPDARPNANEVSFVKRSCESLASDTSFVTAVTAEYEKHLASQFSIPHYETLIRR